jgi:hypothetical protein
VLRDELWTAAGVLAMTAGAGAMIAVEAIAGEMPCAGSISSSAGVIVGRGVAGNTPEETW